MKSLVITVSALLVALTTGSPAAFNGDLFWHGRDLARYPNGRIVGGEDTSILLVPHQVSIELWGGLYCGGSIISETWILTAGHCATRAVSSYTVRTGSDKAGNGGTVHRVAEIIRHEKYTTTYYGVPVNDIALFRLETELSLGDGTSKIDLFDATEVAQPGAYSVITGWGRDEWGQLPDQLQTVTVPVISKEECNKAYAKFGGIPVGQICAAYPEGGKDACQGDSGGPMTIEGRLAGIVSWGNGCGLPGNPGAYTEVAYYRDWIRQHSGI